MVGNSSILKWVLRLVALHSLGVFMGLVFMPSPWVEWFGFHPITEPFFRVQGGVFHLVMAYIYFMASQDLTGNRPLIKVSFTAKFMATVFLIIYFVLVDSNVVVLLSGIGDFAMGLAIFFFYKKSLEPSE